MSTTTFENLPLAKLHESPLNPRRHFDAAKLAELTASIQANGVRTPLHVRPDGRGGYEIGAGHRRYRAATAAGISMVPAIVREMSDQEFLELLNFENLEREDVHPLEEADGYRTLMDKAGHDVDSIAARIGKSVKYVYDRVKLLQLGAPARHLFLEGTITAGHAILLARLSPKDQVRCIGTAGDEHRDGGLLRAEATLWDPTDSKDDKTTYRPVSVRELEAWIDEHVKFEKATADPMLFPETAQTVQQAITEKEKVVQITYESYVQADARDEKERIYGPRSWKDATNKACPKTITGVVVVGPDRGRAMKVCTNKDCKVHFAAEIKERERNRKARENGASSAADRSYQRAEAKRQAEEQAKKDREERWAAALPKVLEGVAAGVKKASTRSNGEIARLVIRACTPDRWHSRTIKIDDYLTRGSSGEDVLRYCAFMELVGMATDPWNASKTFPSVAKSFGVDVAKILKAQAKAASPTKAEAAGKK